MELKLTGVLELSFPFYKRKKQTNKQTKKKKAKTFLFFVLFCFLFLQNSEFSHIFREIIS